MATRKPGTGPARPQGRIAETRHPEIKARHRALRADLPTALDLKIHRALSWLDRAEQETKDEDTRFILLWIGFNAAYARRIDETFTSEQGRFKAFFRKLVDLDDRNRIYAVLWSRFSNEIRTLLVNPYVFPDFWRHQNGEPGFADWRARLEDDRRETLRLLGKQETREVLGPIFERLYVLRNQLVHGGATWNGRVNRDQVRDGAALLGRLLPAFIEIMMDHPRRDWGEPFYPVVQA